MNGEDIVALIIKIATIMPLIFWGILVCAVIKSIKTAKQNTRGVVMDVSGKAVGTEGYIHPCAGQCEDQIVVLNKSPTPMYRHNCRAPCRFASRSGRYYRGKQRKRAW